MYKKYLFVLIAGLFILVNIGCSGFEELKVGNIRSMEIKGFENNKLSLTVTLPVENPNHYKVKVKNTNLRIMKDDVELGKVVQINNLQFKGKSSQDYPLDLTIELTGLKGDLFAMYNVLRDRGRMRLSGDLTAGYLFYSKKIKVDYPLSY